MKHDETCILKLLLCNSCYLVTICHYSYFMALAVSFRSIKKIRNLRHVATDIERSIKVKKNF